MIIRYPSRVRRVLGDPSSLPARTGNASWLLTEWSWGSRVQRQEATAPRPTVDHMPSFSSVVPPSPPSLSPTIVIPSPLPVLTSLTHSPSLSNVPNPTLPNPYIPLENTLIPLSNAPPPESTPFQCDAPPGSTIPVPEVPIFAHHTESSTGT